MRIQKYSIGIGDRFGHQAKAQIKAIIKAEENGLDIDIVWNKSHREHLITKTSPPEVVKEAQKAVEALKWKGNYYIDADHIRISNVDLYIDSCNYFTLDVAEFIGKKASVDDINIFIYKYEKYLGEISLPNIKEKFKVESELLYRVANEYIFAVKEAKKIYQKIEEKKGKNNFITEISMDETNKPQTPLEIFFILAIIAEEKIPIQTFAPKFYGIFHKGVDFRGDIEQFTREFNELLAVIQFAITEFSLPDNLKLSIHSGSDKFSIYKIINKAIKKFNTGVHLKTSGTTWLEELAGLALAGGEGLNLVKEIYNRAYNNINELSKPYLSVTEINKNNLPPTEIVKNWTSQDYFMAIHHDRSCKDYNPDFRQLLHLGYKIAAEMGARYIDALRKYEDLIALNVIENIFSRHIKPLFL